MGLKEQLNAGANLLKREPLQFFITGSQPVYTGSLDLGRTFVLTSIQSTTPCRIRLYGNQYSRNEINELARPYISQSIPQDIALIADINFDALGIFNFYPPLFGANLENAVTETIYYTIDSSSIAPIVGTNTIQFNRFVMEDKSVVGLPGVSTRETVLITGSVAPGNMFSGSITTPKTYLLLQATPSTSPIRVRLYSDSSYRDDTTEKNRPFSTEPISSSGLITDMYMDTTATASLTPILLGRNANDTLYNSAYASSITYYTITNESVASDVSASLYLFSLED